MSSKRWRVPLALLLALGLTAAACGSDDDSGSDTTDAPSGDTDGPTIRFAPQDFAESKTHARVGVPVKQGKHPVVLFSPGLGFSRFLNTALLEDLASQGYLVVAMDHTHESPVEFPGGRFRVMTMSGRRVERLVMERGEEKADEE